MAGWLQESGSYSAVEDEINALARSVRPRDPGFWDNAMTATGEGVMRGGALAAQTAMLAGSVVPQALDLVTAGDNYSGKSLTHRYFETFDETITDAVNHWMPDQRTTGTAGRVLSGLAEFGMPMLLSGGNPLAMAALTSAQVTAATGADIARAGGTAAEAGGVAAVQGAANLAGFGIATMGKTVLQRAAFGAGSNVALNMPADAASQAILGDLKLAEQYNPFNLETRSIDLIVGALFGALARGERPPVRDTDAASTVRLAEHGQTDSSPGILVTPKAKRAHSTELQDMQRKIIEGKPIEGNEGSVVEFKPDQVREEQTRQMALALDDEISAMIRSVVGDELPTKATVALVKPTSTAQREFESLHADPIMSRADDVLAENPDMPIALQDNPEDPASVRRLTAREALDEVKADAAKAEERATGYVAAINCFLRGG